MDFVALVIAILALAIASLEAWLNYLRRGRLQMTKPTLISFVGKNGPDPEKVFLRTLLYSTSIRGQMIESMHVCLQHAGSKENFTFWAYDEKGIVPGSGLFIGHEGISYSHHFLRSPKNANYKYVQGAYEVHVYSKLVSDRKPRQLYRIRLQITSDQARELDAHGTGIQFEWQPDQQEYAAHIIGVR